MPFYLHNLSLFFIFSSVNLKFEDRGYSWCVFCLIVHVLRSVFFLEAAKRIFWRNLMLFGCLRGEFCSVKCVLAGFRDTHAGYNLVLRGVARMFVAREKY